MVYLWQPFSVHQISNIIMIALFQQCPHLWRLNITIMQLMDKQWYNVYTSIQPSLIERDGLPLALHFNKVVTWRNRINLKYKYKRTTAFVLRWMQTKATIPLCVQSHSCQKSPSSSSTRHARSKKWICITAKLHMHLQDRHNCSLFSDKQVAACVFEAYDFPYHPQSAPSSRTSNAPSVLQTLRSPLSRGNQAPGPEFHIPLRCASAALHWPDTHAY